MKFFIDTADLAEIRDLAATGLVDGVTTTLGGERHPVPDRLEVKPAPSMPTGRGVPRVRPQFPDTVRDRASGAAAPVEHVQFDALADRLAGTRR